MSKRPTIPQALRYRVLLEAGFGCAFPNCSYSDVDIHHIRDWAKVLKHEYENLIALCPNHHRQAGLGKISIKALELLKAKLQIHYGLPVTSTSRSGLWSTCSIFVSDVPRYEIAVELPQLHAKANVAIPEINTVLYSRALKWIHDLRAQKLFHENSFDPAARLAQASGESDEHTQARLREEWLASKDGLIIGFELCMPSKNIVSIRYNLYSYVHGAAHPNRWVETVNYQLTPAAPLGLWDLLNEEKKTLEFICDLISSSIRKYRRIAKDKDYFSYPTVTRALHSMPQDDTTALLRSFILTADHLVFLFSPYDIASYADGGWEVWIPYKQLLPFANQRGPLFNLSKMKQSTAARRRVRHF